MVSLLFGGAVWFLLGLIPLGIFYFLRMRFRRQPMGSVYLWRKLLQTADSGRRLQWKSVFLLLLQIMALICLVLALASPWLIQSSQRPAGVMYVVDVSASMAARDSGSSGHDSRLDSASKLIEHDLGQLARDTPVAIFLGGDRLDLLPSFQGNHGHTARDAAVIVRELAGRAAGESDFDEAALASSLAAWIALDGGVWSLVYVGDGGVSLGGSALARVVDGRLRALAVSGSAANVGVGNLRVDPERGLASFTVHNGFADSQSLRFSLVHQGFASAQADQAVLASLLVPPGSSQQSMVLTAANSGLWTLSLAGTNDVLAADDRCYLVVPAPQPFRVLHLGPENPFIKAVFSADGIEYRSQASAEGIVAGDQDLIVSDLAELPVDLPGNLLSFAGLPPQAPLSRGPELSGQVHSLENDHPLARSAEWSEVYASRAHSLRLLPQASALAAIGDQVVAAAWEQDGWHNAAIGMSLLDSSLGMAGVFPILIRNMESWALPQAGNPLSDTFRVGEQRQRVVAANWVLDGLGLESHPLGGGRISLLARRAGSWAWHEAGRSGLFAVNLPSGESDLTPRNLSAAQSATSQPSSDSKLPTTMAHIDRLNLTLLPALMAMFLLLGEWYLWQGRGKPQGRGRLLAGLRLGTIVAVLLALVGAAIPLPSHRRMVAIALDASDSIGPAQLNSMRSDAMRLVQKLSPDDRVALISFAASPRLVSGLVSPSELAQVLPVVDLSNGDASATDLHAAVDLATQVLQNSRGNHELFIWTDGRPTSGGSLADLSTGSPGLIIHAIPVMSPRAALKTGGLKLPDNVHPNERIVLNWPVEARQNTQVLLNINRDGQSQSPRRITIPAGASELSIPVQASGMGRSQLIASLSLPDGSPLAGAQAGAVVTVGPAARVLLINGEKTPSPLAQSLINQGMQVQSGDIGLLPDSDEGWGDISALILDSLPALEVSGAQQDALLRWVAGGGGLVVIGGTQGLGRGEYSATALEDLLPVSTDTRRRLYFTRSRILFVVDHSGSMTEDVGNMTKLEAAMHGVAASVAQLNAVDEVGVLTFDSAPTWLLPFTNVSKRTTILNALSRISEGGGTDMASALEEVVASFGEPGPVRRHVVILTDGQTINTNANFREMVDHLRNVGVTISTIGVGDTIDEALLRSIAQWGGGQYWRAKGDKIPQVMTKETVRVTRDLIQEGRFQPLVHSSGGAIAGLEDKLPPIAGYQITRAKASARILLELEDQGDRTERGTALRDPLLVSWHFGSGQVAVFAGDSGRRWLPAWSGSQVYARFWSQLVRSVERGGRDHGLQARAQVAASTVLLSVDAAGPDGHLQAGLDLIGRHGNQNFNLIETAPGHYVTRVPMADSGLARFEVAERGTGKWTDAWVWNPPSSEMAGDGSDLAGLGRLASANGGVLLPGIGDSLPVAKNALNPVPLAPWLLMAAILVFLIEMGLRSTALGQASLAWALLHDWWIRQIAGSRPEIVNASTDSYQQRDPKPSQDAWRYLAQRVHERDEARRKAQAAALAAQTDQPGDGED